MRHAVELFLKEMGYQLCDGYSVNAGYFTAGALIRGVFDSPQETSNVDKHSILFQFNQGGVPCGDILEIIGVADASTTIL